MKCFYHPAADSVQGCRTCGKWLCAACAHSIKGSFYCQDCLVKGAELSAVASSASLSQESPTKAALFALVPGMGAIYNRQYVKGLIHFSIFAALCLVADRGHPIFGLAAFAFWVFQIMDAYRSAQNLIRERLANPEWKAEDDGINAPVWGIVLMGVGVLFLLDNLVDVEIFRFLDKFWPLAFVGLGLYLIFGYTREKKHTAVAAPPATLNLRSEALPQRGQDKEGPRAL